MIFIVDILIFLIFFKQLKKYRSSFEQIIRILIINNLLDIENPFISPKCLRGKLGNKIKFYEIFKIDSKHHVFL